MKLTAVLIMVLSSRRPARRPHAGRDHRSELSWTTLAAIARPCPPHARISLRASSRTFPQISLMTARRRKAHAAVADAMLARSVIAVSLAKSPFQALSQSARMIHPSGGSIASTDRSYVPHCSIPVRCRLRTRSRAKTAKFGARWKSVIGPETEIAALRKSAKTEAQIGVRALNRMPNLAVPGIRFSWLTICVTGKGTPRLSGD